MARKITGKLLFLSALTFALLSPASFVPKSDTASAGQFRQLNRIRVPVEKKDLAALEDGFTQVSPPIPLPRRLSERLIKRVVHAWNTDKLGGYLAKSFNDKQRLLDTIREDVPRDARLHVIGVQGVDILSQQIKGEGRGFYRVKSVAAARVRLRIEYDDPTNGFTTINTSGEYIFDVGLRVRKLKRRQQ